MAESKSAMQIYLLRHGIADDPVAGQADAERALTDEGRERLKKVLALGRRARMKPSLILSSPYKRAMQTAQIAAKELGYAEAIDTSRTLVPSGRPEEIWGEIRLQHDAKQLLLVGHEPCLSRLGAYLLGALELQIDMKKAGLLRIDVHGLGAQPRGVLKWLAAPKLTS